MNYNVHFIVPHCLFTQWADKKGHAGEANHLNIQFSNVIFTVWHCLFLQ